MADTDTTTDELDTDTQTEDTEHDDDPAATLDLLGELIETRTRKVLDAWQAERDEQTAKPKPAKRPAAKPKPATTVKLGWLAKALVGPRD